VKIKAAGANLLYNMTTAKFAAQAIKKVAELGWKPVHIVDVNSTSVRTVLEPAGLENSKDIISVKYAKDPSDPRWKEDPGMQRYFSFMDQYYPEADKFSSFNSYGYMAAQIMEHILRKCGDNLTRENVMNVATNLTDVVTDLTLPGMSGSTTPTNYRLLKQFQMMKFTGEHWEAFGPILADPLNWCRRFSAAPHIRRVLSVPSTYETRYRFWTNARVFSDSSQGGIRFRTADETRLRPGLWLQALAGPILPSTRLELSSPTDTYHE
jgi:hypothetical protein